MSKKQAKTDYFPPNLIPEKSADFVQIKDRYLKDIRVLISQNPVSAQILFLFIEKMGKFNNSIVCSYQTLIEITGFSRATISRAIKLLKDQNWIDTVKIGSATAYCVNAQVAWRKANNQRHYAIFSSTIIASSSENKDYKTNKKLRNIPYEINRLENPNQNAQMDLLEGNAGLEGDAG
ncbi:TPA: replication/maintenance protein RepL [Salmonella enterica subsp. enterica serovar Stanley]